jgi:hypothetical protein
MPPSNLPGKVTMVEGDMPLVLHGCRDMAMRTQAGDWYPFYFTRMARLLLAAIAKPRSVKI